MSPAGIPFPTLPGKVRGIVGQVTNGQGRSRYTLQCENCLALETPDLLVLMKTHFHRCSINPDPRRLCPDCRADIFANCECASCREELRELGRRS